MDSRPRLPPITTHFAEFFQNPKPHSAVTTSPEDSQPHNRPLKRKRSEPDSFSGSTSGVLEHEAATGRLGKRKYGSAATDEPERKRFAPYSARGQDQRPWTSEGGERYRPRYKPDTPGRRISTYDDRPSQLESRHGDTEGEQSQHPRSKPTDWLSNIQEPYSQDSKSLPPFSRLRSPPDKTSEDRWRGSIHSAYETHPAPMEPKPSYQGQRPEDKPEAIFTGRTGATDAGKVPYEPGNPLYGPARATYESGKPINESRPAVYEFGKRLYGPGGPAYEPESPPYEPGRPIYEPGKPPYEHARSTYEPGIAPPYGNPSSAGSTSHIKPEDTRHQGVPGHQYALDPLKSPTRAVPAPRGPLMLRTTPPHHLGRQSYGASLGYATSPNDSSPISGPLPPGSEQRYTWDPPGLYEHSHRKRRGNLPKESTALLTEWFNKHANYPYPKEAEKQQLQAQTGLAMSQISNWFVNARRRRRPSVTTRVEHPHPPPPPPPPPPRDREPLHTARYL